MISHLAFWGKTRQISLDGPGWHPVSYHGLDVAAVASVLLRACRVPPVDPAFHSLVLALVALHDIGKFTRTFQCKVPDLWPTALGAFRAVSESYGHDTAGYGLLTGPLTDDVAGTLLPRWGNSGRALLRAVCGHHGRPPGPIDAMSGEDACDVCIGVARSFAAEAVQVVGAAPVAFPGKVVALRLAWQLAGLAVLADWIGSNEAWFAAQAAQMPLAGYWADHALPQAADAVARAGIVPASARRRLSLSDLAAHATEATPLQILAATMELTGEGPSLVVIEDQTGAGKTEAALLLAHRMMVAGQARGVFVALPTMATANAMYLRLADAYRVLFEAGETPSLVLAHGRRALHQGFQKSILPQSGEAVSPDHPSADPADETAGAQCAAWVASDRRRAFLADVGVGTVDQALLAVLPARHAALRLLGLSQRVLIVDEAHAYDAYMLRELETLVAFHAGLGGSAIVLSATLPQARRAALVAAFHRGAGGEAPNLVCDHYPLVTVASVGGGREEPCAPRRDLGRTVLVERLAVVEDVVARIAVAARAGLAVAWVRNAVDDAIEGHAALRAQGIEADLFHARFAMGDRLEIEAAAMARFGRTARQAERAGRVLVATQVIEQSLDLDFDLIVSDLAPIDLLIQRAGRLWRHRRQDRPAEADAPRLLVLSPEPVDAPGADWLSGPLRRTGHVYPHAGLLWRTAREIFAVGKIDTPGDVRRLVESVYAAPDDVPEGLRHAQEAADGAERAAGGMAELNVLKWADGYQSGQGWDSDVRTPTRLSEDSVTFRLARWDGGVLTPWCEAESPRLAWALSEVTLAAWRAQGVPAPSGALAAAVAEAKRDWGRWEQEMPLLALSRSAGDWAGCVVTDKGVERRAICDPQVGLLVI